MTEKKKQMYICEDCEQEWDRKYNYTRHLTSEKHTKMSKKSREILKLSKEILKNEQEPDSIDNCNDGKIAPKICVQKKMETRYCCDYCQFSTTIKREATKHRKSKQHMKNENKEEDFLEITAKYVCLSCDKMYDKYVSCWKHSKQCDLCDQGESNRDYVEPGEKENVVMDIVEQPCGLPYERREYKESIKREIIKEVCDSFIDKMMENNQQNQNTIIKIVETMSQSQHALVQTSNSNNNITNNHTINNNQHCTINMFLNEKCKDAINITDWVDNLVINFEHLYYNAENGFQKGLTKMLIDNLKLYNVCKRPIHFTDVKRETMYIKDADAWTKHENHDKLIEVLETGARQSIQCFAEWMEENTPAYHNLDSPLGQQYMAIHQNVIRPHTERMKAYPKVVKEVARAVQLRKGDQDQA